MGYSWVCSDAGRLCCKEKCSAETSEVAGRLIATSPQVKSRREIFSPNKYLCSHRCTKSESVSCPPTNVVIFCLFVCSLFSF